jgi:hypothetical protein
MGARKRKRPRRWSRIFSEREEIWVWVNVKSAKQIFFTDEWKNQNGNVRKSADVKSTKNKFNPFQKLEK